MDIDTLMDLVNAKINDDARRSGVLTLGAVRDALAAMPPDLPVVIDNGGTPGGLTSYRGHYERLAITPASKGHTETALIGGGPAFYSLFIGHYQPGASRVTIATPCTVAGLVQALDLADGEDFEGYKGGQFAMGRHTFMHVANYGNCGRAVVGLRVDADRVVIETAEEV